MLVQLFRTVILFILIVASVRLMGKRTIGELQASELVITMMLADIAAVPMQDIGIPLLSGIVPMAILVVMEIFLSGAMLKSTAISRFISGSPVMVVHKGVINQSALRRLRMTNADLFEELRKQGIFELDMVSCAIVETDGTLSTLKKPEEEPPSCKVLGISQPSSITLPIVSDGSPDNDAMQNVGWSMEQINQKLWENKLELSEVFLMTAGEDGSYGIVKKEMGR